MLAGTVVVAEDSAAARHTISTALRPYGFTVVTVGSGRDALSKCRESAPDVVLLDVDMPHLDEFATLDGLRLMAGLERVPVLFLTKRTGVSDVVRAVERGAHDVVRAPIDAGDLLARVSAAIRVKRLEDAVGRATVRRIPGEAAAAAASPPQPAPHATGSRLPRLTGEAGTGACAVVLVDVDQLTQTQDRYGAPAAEELLGVVGRRLASRLRASDSVERWGHERFAVLLPDTPLDGAMLVAERLRATISRTAIQVSGAGLLDVTVSCGVAASAVGATDSVLRDAVTALASAQAAGRNVVRAAA